MAEFRWSSREMEALKAAGKTDAEIENSMECVHIAGPSWLERNVK